MGSLRENEEKWGPGATLTENIWNHAFLITGIRPIWYEDGTTKRTLTFLLKKAGVQTPRTPQLHALLLCV